MRQIPVVGITGSLGAGKTSVLNHLLRRSRARVGVVVNDFGEINVDAALVTGQVDEPVSIGGGCICCLDDGGGLDDALARLTSPRLDLEVVLIEASGIADPLGLARLIRYSGVERVRFGGLVHVVDATRIEDHPIPEWAISVAVLNRIDLLAAARREQVCHDFRQIIRAAHPQAAVVTTAAGAVDPALIFDRDTHLAATRAAGPHQLSFTDLWAERASGEEHSHTHETAQSVAVSMAGEVDPGLVLDLLENSPEGAYRIKGIIRVAWRSGVRSYVLNAVGPYLHAARWPGVADRNELVAIGVSGLDPARTRVALLEALAPREGLAPSAGMGRLLRLIRLSV